MANYMSEEELVAVRDQLLDIMQGPELCLVHDNDPMREEARVILQHAANDIERLAKAYGREA